MRSHHRTMLLLSTLTACGGSGFSTADPPTTLDEAGQPMPANTYTSNMMPAPTATAVGSGTSDPPAPTMEAGAPTSSGSISGSMSGSTSGATVDPPTMEAGSLSGATSGSLGTSGSMVGGSGGMSGASGGLSGGVVVPPTCSGAASQACGNCNSGTQTRTCNAGVWSAWGACTGETPATLISVGVGNFTISFDLVDSTTGEQAVVNQRTDCLGATSPHPFWDVRLNTPACTSAGSLEVDTYNITQGVSIHCTNGRVSGHHIELHRVSGTLTFLEDGLTTNSWADGTDLTGLAALATGTDICPGVAPLAGTISNLCVEKQ